MSILGKSSMIEKRSQQFSPGITNSPPGENRFINPAEEDALRDCRRFNFELADQKIKTALNGKTLQGEQFRFLRTRLAQLQRQNGFKKLLITSSIPGEGKTFVSCCLATTLAMEPGKRVLLIDADLRRPQTARHLGVQKQETSGLCEVLQGTHKFEDVTLHSSDFDLFYLPAGRTPENPSELLASDGLGKVMAQKESYFDWIIIDSPPALAFADPIRIASFCDSALIVIGANSTPSKMIQKTVQTIGKNLICGLIMNRVKSLRNSNYYYHYYSEDGNRVK